jgi:hypothetical protein
MNDAVHNGLRRIDGAVAARDRIGALALAVTVQRQSVLPTEIIPVIDRQAERDDGGIVRQIAEQLVGRRA